MINDYTVDISRLPKRYSVGPAARGARLLDWIDGESKEHVDEVNNISLDEDHVCQRWSSVGKMQNVPNRASKHPFGRLCRGKPRLYAHQELTS